MIVGPDVLQLDALILCGIRKGLQRKLKSYKGRQRQQSGDSLPV